MRKTHEIALDLLKDEKRMIVDTLIYTKDRLNYLCKLRTTDDVMYANYIRYYNGNISKLTRDRNELRRRLHEVEDTVRLLKADGQARSDMEWYQQSRERTKQGSYNCLGGC